MDNENLKKEIEDIKFPVRAYFAFGRADIATIGDLVTKTEADLLKIRGFGKKSLKEVKDILQCMGLKLLPPTRPPRRPRPDTEVVRAADRFITALKQKDEDPDSVHRSETELVRAVCEWRKSKRT